MHGNHTAFPPPEEPPEQNSLGEENNVGSKLLKMMGWKEGEGLGRNSSGMTAPIEVELRSERAGLGATEKTRKEDVVHPNDSYQIAAKKKARARFYSLMGGNSEDAEDAKRSRFNERN